MYEYICMCVSVCVYRGNIQKILYTVKEMEKLNGITNFQQSHHKVFSVLFFIGFKQICYTRIIK